MKRKISEHKIKSIEPGSIAQELELEPGDVLLTVNGEPVEDIFDYHKNMRMILESPLRTVSWMSTVPAGTNVFSASLIKCLRV